MQNHSTIIIEIGLTGNYPYMNATVLTALDKTDPVFFKPSSQPIGKNILLCPYLLPPLGILP